MLLNLIPLKVKEIRDKIKDVKDFLQEMSDEETQCTARYRYYTVLQDIEREVYCSEDAEKTYYIYNDDCYSIITEEQYNKLPETEDDDPEFEDEEGNKWYQDDFREYKTVLDQEEDRCFLTRAEAERHIAANKHHYKNNPRPCCHHFFRTPNQDAFFDALFYLFRIPKPKG
jgi:hypothetical protein